MASDKPKRPAHPVLTPQQAEAVLRRQGGAPPTPIGLEARVDPPHLGKELAQLRAMFRQCERTRTTIPMRVTQNMAEAMLFLRVKKNRKISKAWLAKLKVILLSGRFHGDIARVIFDWDGDLRDAQHRLMAIRETGVEVEMDVTFGVDPAAFPAMDVGLRRTAQQFLELDGHKYAGSIAAIVRLRHRIDHAGIMPDDEEVYLEARDLIDDVMHRALVRAVQLRNKRKVILSSAALAYRLIALGAQRALSIDQFWDRLVVGDQLPVTSPIFKLREHFEREAAAKDRKARQLLTQTQHAAWIIQAWNAWTVGHSGVGFRWPHENDLPVVK